MKSWLLVVIILYILTLSCSNNNAPAEIQGQSHLTRSSGNAKDEDIIPTDEYYQKIENEYSDFRSRFRDPFKDELDKIPKETKNAIKAPNQLIKCFETKAPDLPGIPETLTRPVFRTSPYGINVIYHTQIGNQRFSETSLHIDIYKNYEQARRFVVHRVGWVAQRGFPKPDEKKIGDYSWSHEAKPTSSSFRSPILFSNLGIFIDYQEWIENLSGRSYPPIDVSKRKDEVCQAIIKMIEECQ